MLKKLFGIVAILFALLVVAVAVLWFVGGKTYVNTAEVTIDAPPSQVFPYLTEPDKLKQWLAGVVEIKPLTEGGHRVGAKGKIVVEEQGNKIEMEDEVLRSEDNKLLELRIFSPIFEINNLYELTDDQGKTHLKLTMQAKYSSVMRVFAPLVEGAIQELLDANFQRLKQLVEAK